MAKKKNTKISYLYRDASNYKEHGGEVLKGELSADQIQEILSKRHDGEYFIPSNVGLDDLQEKLQGFDSEDYGDDHCWHELEDDGIQLTDEKPTIKMTAEELYQNFMKKGIKKEYEVGHILTGNFQGKTPAVQTAAGKKKAAVVLRLKQN